MNRCISLLFLSLLFAFVGCSRTATSASHTTGGATDDALLLTPATQDPSRGEWRGDIAREEDRRVTHVMLGSEAAGWRGLGSFESERLHATGDGYRIGSAVGSLQLHHDESSSRSDGTFAVLPDDDVRDRHPAIGGTLTADDRLRLILSGVDDAYLAALTADGHTMTWDQVAALHPRGVTAEYVRAIRRARATPPAVVEPAPPDRAGLDQAPAPGPLPEFSVDDIVYLATRGVEPAFVEAMQRAGYRFDAKDLYYLRSRGVQADYATELRDAGYHLSAKELYYLRSRGVESGFAAQLRAIGYDLSPSDLYYLRSRGVEADFVGVLRDAGYRLSPKELYYLRSRGIDAAFARRLREIGYDLSPEELYYLKSRGVSADYAAALAAPGKELLTPKQLYHLHSRGVEPEMVHALRAQTPSAESSVR